jgi:GNAT superfamily N-acetyltransferase
MSAPRPRLVPLRDQPAEALRLLGEYEEEFPEEHRDWLRFSIGPVRDSLKVGSAEGRLWWGPHDEAIGLALWVQVEGLGRRISDLFLAPGFRSAGALASFLEALEREEMSQGPIVAVPALIPGIELSTQEKAFLPRGLRTQSRLAMRRSTAAPADRPARPPAGRPLRCVEEADGMWLVRLYQESFRTSPDRFWVEHGDLAEDGRRMWKDLLAGRWGPWIPAASFTHDRPGGLEGASLVCHPKGRCPLLLELMVEPEGQGKGLGRALLARTLTSLQRAGQEELELNVVRENERAFQLYEHMGFVAVPGTEAQFWVHPAALPSKAPPSHPR